MRAGNVFVAALLAAVLILPVGASAQADTPGAVVSEATETVVVVREINRETRKVTIETPSGERVIIVVPPEAQNLDQVNVGSKFRMRYLQSVAVFISPTGGQPEAVEHTEVQLAEKGATPGRCRRECQADPGTRRGDRLCGTDGRAHRRRGQSREGHRG